MNVIFLLSLFVFLCSLISSEAFSITEKIVTKEQILQQEVLEAHNKWRFLHHAPSLTWDEELEHYAQRHARHCVFQHSSSPYGENLAAGYPSITAAIKAWYDENQLYSYQQSTYSHQTGHFTQVVWIGTQKLGCAYVACSKSNKKLGNFLVCEYSPAGNVINTGYFKKNVLPI